MNQSRRAPAGPLPHLDRIQQAFGRHDARSIQAHVGSQATSSAEAIQARAFAMGEHVVFAGDPDLHTAAHEAAHVVQQRSGVRVPGGISEVDDAYEGHADAVARRVVAGQSAEALLARFAPGPGVSARQVQRKKTEEERGTKNRRVTKAKEAIGKLKDCLKDSLKRHLFNALPVEGSTVNPQAPTGLHAYTKGGLPEGIEQVERSGSNQRVHELTWKWKDNIQQKTSTMFPIWLPVDHVCTLIALEFPENTEVVKHRIDLKLLGISKEQTKKYISRGQTLKIGKSGDTVYPVR